MYSQKIFTENLDSTMSKYYYETLRDRVYSIIYYLRKSINSLNDVDNKILSNYTIDDSGVDNVLVESVREELVSRVNYLNYTIIPALNSKIDSLN